MKQEEFYSFIAMFDVEIAEKYKRDTEVKMQTDFDKLMDILKIEEKDRKPLFNNIICGNVDLVLFYEDDGSISWGTLGDDWDEDYNVDETGFDPYAGCYTDDC